MNPLSQHIWQYGYHGRMSEAELKPAFFERQDPSPDALFYAEPRLVTHIDDHAIAAASKVYGELLPNNAAILDLMSSYRSHMPPDLAWTRLAGLGMNEVELRENDQLTDYVVHDLNANPRMPYGDAEFDGAVVTVSVQYMTRPVEIFADVARVLRPGAPFILTYSNRLFPTKAVRIWLALDARERAALIGTYFKRSGGFGDVSAADAAGNGPDGGPHDPLFAVWAHRIEA